MPRPPTGGLLVATLLVLSAACAGPGADHPEENTPAEDTPGAEGTDTIYVSLESVEDIERFFGAVSFTPQTWADGVREIPRMYITAITDRWKERTQTELDVSSKKRIFFRAMAPLALRSNELIRAERDRLTALAEAGTLTPDDRLFLADIGADYGVVIPDRDDDMEAWAELKREVFLRVDEVPVSLVLAQAANESGWGTSRFAREGNALFGQWTFGGSGMLPEAQRTALGDYRVAAFETPLMSIAAYMRNLNTHRAYARLRELRAQMRARGEPLSGWELAGTLDRYSERGQAYVDELRQIIDVNRLQEADPTYLADGPVYLLVARDDVPEGASRWIAPPLD